MKTFDIVGYTYRAENLCPRCQVLAFECDPAIRNCEQMLDTVATSRGIDRYDEHSFDSRDFPKVVFSGMVEDDELCGHCNEPLVES